jgi:hypothetical protein
MPRCSICKTQKPCSEFYRKPDGSCRASCIACAKVAATKHGRKNATEEAEDERLHHLLLETFLAEVRRTPGRRIICPDCHQVLGTNEDCVRGCARARIRLAQPDPETQHARERENRPLQTAGAFNPEYAILKITGTD